MFIDATLLSRFHKLERWPRGLVPIADSICRFNPLFGQGMSVAAIEAIVLGQLLAKKVESSDPLDGLGAGGGVPQPRGVVPGGGEDLLSVRAEGG